MEALQQIIDADIGVEREVIVIDDGSTDGTAAALASKEWPEDVHFLSHPVNRGKGAAVRTGLAEAKGTYTAIMDADMEYDPADLRKLMAAAEEGHDVVFGVRTFEAHSAHSFWYVVGNRFVTFLGNFLYNCWLTDMCACHTLLPTELFRSLDLREPGFGIEAEITARLVRRGVPIYEVPVAYEARSHEQGKKLTSMDGFRVLRTLVRCRIS